MRVPCMQGDVLADGSDAGDVARWRARRDAEAAVAAAEAAAKAGEAGAAARLAAAERQLEEVLEAGEEMDGHLLRAGAGPYNTSRHAACMHSICILQPKLLPASWIGSPTPAFVRLGAAAAPPCTHSVSAR